MVAADGVGFLDLRSATRVASSGSQGRRTTAQTLLRDYVGAGGSLKRPSNFDSPTLSAAGLRRAEGSAVAKSALALWMLDEANAHYLPAVAKPQKSFVVCVRYPTRRADVLERGGSAGMSLCDLLLIQVTPAAMRTAFQFEYCF